MVDTTIGDNKFGVELLGLTRCALVPIKTRVLGHGPKNLLFIIFFIKIYILLMNYAQKWKWCSLDPWTALHLHSALHKWTRYHGSDILVPLVHIFPDPTAANFMNNRFLDNF